MTPLYTILAKQIGHAFFAYMQESEAYCAVEFKRAPVPISKVSARVNADILSEDMARLIASPGFKEAIRAAAMEDAV